MHIKCYWYFDRTMDILRGNTGRCQRTDVIYDDGRIVEELLADEDNEDEVVNFQVLNDNDSSDGDEEDNYDEQGKKKTNLQRNIRYIQCSILTFTKMCINLYLFYRKQ